MSNIAWKSDLFHQEVAPRVARPYLSVIHTPAMTRSKAPAGVRNVSGAVYLDESAFVEQRSAPVQAAEKPMAKAASPGKMDTIRTAGRGDPAFASQTGSTRTSQFQAQPRSKSAADLAGSARREGGDEGLRRILLALIVIFSLIIVGEVIFQMGIAPELAIKSIEMDVEPGVPLDQVQSLLGLGGKLLYYACDEALMTEVLKSLPQVRDARVEKRFPDVLAVHATARKALVQARVRGRHDKAGSLVNGGQSAVLIDQDACAYAWAAEADQNLPVLSGIDFENFRLGVKLPSSIKEFLGDLEAIRASSPEIYQAFSEFRLVPLGQNSVEVLVYTMTSDIPVRINNRLTADNALYILRTMTYVPGHSLGKDVVEVDFRTQNVILRKGEN